MRSTTLTTPLRVRQCCPTMMFSSAVISLNRRMFWKVRATPSLVTFDGSMPAISRPLKRMVPDVGL